MTGTARVPAALLGLAVFMVGARPALALDPARYLPPPGAPYSAEEVGVRTTGTFSLAGTFTVPRDGRRRHPVVVLISDAGRQDRNAADGRGAFRPFYDLADTLGRRGIAVLRLDDRGVGASTGSIDTMTTYERSVDVRAALAFLMARPDVLSRKLGLVGMGEGASIAALIAADDPELAGLVLLGAPNRTGRELMKWQLRRAADEDSTLLGHAGRDTAYAGRLAAWERKAAGDPWTRYFAGYDPLGTARRVRAPVLLLQGAEDDAVPASDAPSLAAAFGTGSSDVSTRVFPGLDHELLRPADIAGPGSSVTPAEWHQPPEVRGAVADWLARHLAPGPELPEPRRPVHTRKSGHHRRRR